MTISFDDFLKVDIRVGKIIKVEDFPEAHKPAYKLTIDLGEEIGVKRSSAQVIGAHTKEELEGMPVCCIVNFPPKQIGPFESEVLTLGFENTNGDGWILISPSKENVELGSRLQ